MFSYQSLVQDRSGGSVKGSRNCEVCLALSPRLFCLQLDVPNSRSSLPLGVLTSTHVLTTAQPYLTSILCPHLCPCPRFLPVSSPLPHVISASSPQCPHLCPCPHLCSKSSLCPNLRPIFYHHPVSSPPSRVLSSVSLASVLRPPSSAPTARLTHRREGTWLRNIPCPPALGQRWRPRACRTASERGGAQGTRVRRSHCDCRQSFSGRPWISLRRAATSPGDLEGAPRTSGAGGGAGAGRVGRPLSSDPQRTRPFPMRPPAAVPPHPARTPPAGGAGRGKG